ncbi:hypothetical protein BJ138DRAFT_1153788 [Hygrophoropsis aurantiaca]|uniref:Uncharacterized protein n=1 Tax=Hygrophoropsis aurantiaca TaxID=72124 RepID=A0ACB8AAD7_9AGAM|nr:hypothetical protein BJ138DRAFT_1153788 [Hygrophoropsis aurantiaca]
MSSKRQRTPSRLSSRPSSPQPEPMSKSSRTSDPGNRPLLCTLPPTCNPPHHQATAIANSKDLELHYAKYHAHVCEQRGCGLVFPDARLLELHQTECHDPIAALRKDRGEKIFACHLMSCPRLFLTPKARRLHLVQAHSYPKEYFFAVTNKGVGGLLKRWGDGASMIRGAWKPRESSGEDEEDDAEDADTDDDDEESDDEMNGEQTPKVKHFEPIDDGPRHAPSTTMNKQHQPRSPPKVRDGSVPPASGDVDSLAQSMTSLSLVPPSIRFGRGGKNGGFVHPELHNPNVNGPTTFPSFGARGGRGRARIATAVHPPAGGHHSRGGVPNAAGKGAVGGDPNAISYINRGVARGIPQRGIGRGDTRGRGRGG